MRELHTVPRRPEDSDAEQLLAAVLQQPAADQHRCLDRVCADHPARADELRALFSRLQEIGLVDRSRGETDAAFPQRLGEFRLLRRLDAGGMGVVFLARQEPVGRRVALKLLHPGSLLFPAARRRFQREACISASLHHPGIAPVHAYGEQNGIPYLAMEYVEGCTLAQVLAALARRSPAALDGRDLGVLLPDATGPRFAGTWPAACMRLIADVADALHYAHSHGVLHRDVKPANIMLTPTGRAVLLDFGLARTREFGSLTAPGTRPGSLPYMSPEQARGDEVPLDARSDLYALGVTLYELLTLRQPFLTDAEERTRRRVTSGRCPPVRSCNPAVPRDAATVCHKTMRLHRENRYACVADLARDLRAVLACRPIAARRPSPASRGAKWARRNPLLAGMAALVLLLLAGGLLWSLDKNRQLAAARTVAVREGELHRLALERLLRLSDLTRLQRLNERLPTLGPVGPATIDDYERWVRQAEQLVARLPQHQSNLAQLWAAIDQSLPAAGADGGAASQQSATQLQWQHDLLQRLVEQLLALADPDAGDLALMQRRLEFARDEPRRRAAHAERWRRAAAAVAADPKFAGFTLPQRPDLVPLGADPDTGLQEFLHLLTHDGPIPTRDADGRLPHDEHTGIVLVLLPACDFCMGTQSQDPRLPNYDPAPRRETGLDEVRLTPFLLGKFEVTQGQWWRACRRRPSYYQRLVHTRGHRRVELLPVESVDWDETDQVLRALGLCLPTEAQWEYGCRAGTTTIWSTGSEPASLLGYANLYGEENGTKSQEVEPGYDDGYPATAPVGSLLPNGFGLHDMHGNVGEWCRDGHLPYDEFPARPGDGERSARRMRRRCSRGGNFRLPALFAASANRVGNMAHDGRPVIGVRAAMQFE